MTDGDVQALELWHEYEQATKGTRSLVWSPGLRLGLIARCNLTLSTDEKDDEEAATEEPDEVTLEVLVPADLWSGAVALGWVPELLASFEEAGEIGVWEILQRVRR